MLPVLALFALLMQQPEATLPPASAHARFTADAIGVQVYQCGVKDNKFTWTFQEPQADLFDSTTHQPIGTHTAGPTWTWTDGSSVSGKVLQQTHTGDQTNIPWLLLETHAAGSTSGALSNIVYVRRSATQGGTSSNSTCDAEHNGDTIKVPYHATYTFYSAE